MFRPCRQHSSGYLLLRPISDIYYLSSCCPTFPAVLSPHFAFLDSESDQQCTKCRLGTSTIPLPILVRPTLTNRPPMVSPACHYWNWIPHVYTQTSCQTDVFFKRNTYWRWVHLGAGRALVWPISAPAPPTSGHTQHIQRNRFKYLLNIKPRIMFWQELHRKPEKN